MQSGWAIGYAAGRGGQRPRAARVRLARGVLRRHPAGVLHASGSGAACKEPEIWQRGPARAAARRGSALALSRGPRAADDRLDVHEHVHAVRVVGLQSLAPELPLAARVAQGGSACSCSSSSGVHHRHAGRACGSATSRSGTSAIASGGSATYVTLPHRRGAAAVRLRVGPRSDRAARCSVRSSRSSRPAISAGSAPSRRRSYPTAIRGNRPGIHLQLGRIVSALAPFTVGTLAQTHGFGAALSISSAAFLLAAVIVDLDSGDPRARADVTGAFGCRPGSSRRALPGV